MKVCHVDGDIVVFRAAFACEKAVYDVEFETPAPGGGDFSVARQHFDSAADMNAFIKANKITQYVRDRRRIVEPVEYVYSNLHSIMHSIRDALCADVMQVWLTGTGNFRRQLAPSYKANRDPSQRPHWFEEARRFLCEQYGARVVDGMEADDAIGIHYQPHQVIVSTDKDLRTIAGEHFNFVKNQLDAVTEDHADWLFWQQMLTGDAADNVFGLKGIGPVKAAKLVPQTMPPEERAKTVRQLYAKDRSGILNYDVNYHLLRVLRSEKEYQETRAWVQARQVPKT